MKKKTIFKRLQKLDVNKTSCAYKYLFEWLGKSNNDIIRTCHISGRGRYSKNMDYTNDLALLLDKLRVRYTLGNDAPKDGKTGNYILIKL